MEKRKTNASYWSSLLIGVLCGCIVGGLIGWLLKDTTFADVLVIGFAGFGMFWMLAMIVGMAVEHDLPKLNPFDK